MSKKTGIIPNLIGLEGVNKPEFSDPLPESVVDQPRMEYSNEKENKRLMQEHMHLQVGMVQDAVENFIRLHVRDKGEKLHDNQLRTDRCARHLRRYTRASIAKTEAFSIMLQLVGSIDEFISAFIENGMENFKFLGTKKHRDGPNDSRHKYRHTFVLSTLIVKDSKVYRLTIILYSRRSVGRFLSNHGPANTFVQFMKSYRKEYNGDIHYKDQYYKDDGAYYVKRNMDGSVVSKNNKLMGIIPPPLSNFSTLTHYRIIPPLSIYQKEETHFEFLDKFELVQKLLSENSTGISNTEFVQAEIEHCLNKRVKIRKKDPSGGKFQWFYGTIVNICENTNKKGDLLETVLFDDSKADSIKINCRDAHRAVYDYQNHIGHNKNGPPKTNVWHNLQKIEQFVFRYSDCKFPPFPDKPEDPRTSDQKFFCSVCDGDLNGFVQCSNMTEYNKKAKTANCYFSFDESCILKDDNSVAMSHQFKYQSQNFKQNLVNLNTKRNERADCTEPNRHQMFLDRTFGSLKNPQHGAVAYYCKKCPDDNAKVCICYQCLEHKRQLVKQHEELLRRKERLQKLKSNHNGKRAYPSGRRDGVNRSKRMRLRRRKK